MLTLDQGRPVHGRNRLGRGGWNRTGPSSGMAVVMAPQDRAPSSPWRSRPTFNPNAFDEVKKPRVAQPGHHGPASSPARP
ncbi:MAG: hypothetical protein MZV70_20145 [Desulfobacterales bacterium]|nr:hypothetical protein [Desulfobacterales bacterium]